MFSTGSALAATLDEMAGQMILVGFRGANVAAHDVRNLREKIAAGEIGGIMYLKQNVTTLENVTAMNRGFIEAAPDMPPFIAIDQEGGSVERLTRAVGFREIQSAADIARGHTPESAVQIYDGMARSLAGLGFNLNFGPVVDLNINKANPVIARFGRSYSDDAKRVAQFATAFILAHHNAKILTALKHFPGHGSSDSDSHLGFVDITKNWQARELDPYRMLLATGNVDMVMVGHLFHEKFVTNENAQPPSSLSPNWITGVLRKQLNFDGVVISDDMEMSAVRAHFGFRDAILRAVRAGTDILLFSNTADYDPQLADKVHAILVEEAERDPAFRERIFESYQRIAALKSRLLVPEQ